MKKIFLVLLIVLVCSGLVFSQTVKNDKAEKQNALVSFGLGLGVPYGVLGGIVEFSPIKYVGITGGFGYAVEGIGYSVGLRIYPLGNRKWAPMISAYYGIVGAILNRDTFTGGAFGGGVKYKRSKYSIYSEILILVHEKKSYVDYGGSVKFAIGFLYNLIKR